MRIGIITFWRSEDNYGQQLQCWALQQVLVEMGHTPFLIRYVEKCCSEKRKMLFFLRLLKYFLIYPVVQYVIWKKKDSKRKRLVWVNKGKNIKRCFEEFRESHLYYSDKIYYGLNDLQNAPPIADVYICGSDQVWGNILQFNNDEYTSYFLNFGSSSIKRIAYAASYGMISYPKDKKNLLREQLSRFDTISCREKAGVSICNSVGIKASHVLDPTLLLSSFQYETKLKICNSNYNNYIYVYSLNICQPSDMNWNDLRSFALRNNKEVIVTPSTGYYVAEEIFDNVNYLYATIPEWVSLIKYCSLFVASSFHGIVFSILFHRPFVYVPVRGKYSIGNNRVLELLDELHLNSCILNANFSYQWVNIDWDEVDAILEKRKILSLSFLKNSIN